MSVVVDGEIELVSEPSGVPPVRGQGLSASARSDKGSKDESCQWVWLHDLTLAVSGCMWVCMHGLDPSRSRS